MEDPNRRLLLEAARRLQPLLDRLTFVGGCATGLFITDTGAGGVRPTRDVDTISPVAGYAEYVELGERLRSLGFTEDRTDGVLCRWRAGDFILDVMPTDEAVLGFSNRWYAGAIANARTVVLDATSIRVISAPYFLATKVEAFHGRGNRDFAASHDLEDMVAVVDGRLELLDEVVAADAALRRYLAREFRRLLETRQFVDALPGFLLPDGANQARLPNLLERLRALGTVDVR